MARAPKRPTPVSAGRIRARVVRGPRDGRWYWRAETYTEDGDRSVGTRWATRAEAAEWVVSLAADRADLDVAPARRAPGEDLRTVTDLLAEWLGMSEERRDLSPRSLHGMTYSAYAFTGYPEGKRKPSARTTNRKTSVGTIGDVPLDRVTTRTLERHRDLRLAQGYSVATVRREFVALTAAWRWARDVGLTAHEVPAVPLLRARPVRTAYTPTPDEVARTLAHLPVDGWARDVLRLLYATGCRLGEVDSLRVGAVRLGALTVDVDGKTGPRSVPISRETADALRHRVEGRPADAPLWPVTRGTIRGGSMRDMLDAACAAAGVPRWTPHGLRRAAVDRLARAGVDVATAASLLGHSPAVMLQAYRRVTDSDRREAVARAQLGALPGEVVDLEAARGRRR